MLLLIALMGFAAWSVGNNKGAKNLLQSAFSAPQCGQSLGQVRVALEDYRRANKGQYPEDLSALVPNYMHPDILDACGGDVKQLGNRLQYFPPKATTPPDAPVVSIHFGDSSIVPTQVQTLYVRLLKDGRVVLDQVARTEILPSESATRRTDGGTNP
jgi:hypothetical protein